MDEGKETTGKHTYIRSDEDAIIANLEGVISRLESRLETMQEIANEVAKTNRDLQIELDKELEKSAFIHCHHSRLIDDIANLSDAAAFRHHEIFSWALKGLLFQYKDVRYEDIPF